MARRATLKKQKDEGKAARKSKATRRTNPKATKKKLRAAKTYLTEPHPEVEG